MQSLCYKLGLEERFVYDEKPELVKDVFGSFRGILKIVIRTDDSKNNQVDFLWFKKHGEHVIHIKYTDNTPLQKRFYII